MQNLPYLKYLREARNWSQRDLAAKSGVAQDTISQLERGERQARPSTIRKLANALDQPASLVSAITAEEFSTNFAEWRNEQFKLAEARSEERQEKERANYRILRESLLVAYEKLESESLDDMAEAVLLTTRASLGLMKRINERFEGEFFDLYHPFDTDSPIPIADNEAELYRILERLTKPLTKYWLDGAGETRRLLYIQDPSDPTGPQLGDVNLEEFVEGASNEEPRKEESKEDPSW